MGIETALTMHAICRVLSKLNMLFENVLCFIPVTCASYTRAFCRMLTYHNALSRLAITAEVH